MRRWHVLLLVVVALLAGAGLTSYAHHTRVPPTMTGCLGQTSGQLTKLQVSKTTSQRSCVSGETLVHIGGGYITAVITPAESGLTGGKTGGYVALRLDYDQLDARYVEQVSRLTVVSASGTPAENGTALHDAVAAVSGATADNPWLIQLGPGMFDVGLTTLTLPDHVHLAGAGRDVSIVKSVRDFAQTGNPIISLGSTTIRDLTIVMVDNGNPQGFLVAISINDESVVISDINIISGGYGNGIVADRSTVRIFNSAIRGTTSSVVGSNWTGEPAYIQIHDSELNTGALGTHVKCFDSYNSELEMLPSHCYLAP